MKKILLLIANFLIVSQLAKSQSVTIAPTDPAIPEKGTVVFDNATNFLKYYNGTIWVNLVDGSVASGWTTNGNDIFNANTGNVGIGINTPIEKLTVQTTNNSYGISHRSVEGNFLGTYIGGTSAGIGTFSQTNMRIFSNGISRVLIAEATGNVGIGTDNPIEKLTVQTTNNSYGISHRGEGGNLLATYIGGTSAGIGTFSNTNMRIFSNNVSAMLIAAGTANVGIGTDNPTEKLTVQTTNNSYGITHRGDGGNVIGTYIGGTSAGVGTFSHTNMRIFSNGASVMFFAEATGNVGIGTDNPTYKLAVNGTIRAKEVIIETGWADFVFEEGYKLPKLHEVEQFIKENKHLPDVPSATEIQQNGAKLAELTTKMMQKIEELTLYSIEQNKKIEKLQNDLVELKKQK